MSATAIAWLEYDPGEAVNQLWCLRKGDPVRLTAATFSIRSAVNGYGGGAMCLDRNTAYVVEHDTQQVVRIDCRTGTRQQITRDPLSQFGGLVWDSMRGRVLAVREERGEGREGRQQLVAIAPVTGHLTVLAEGEDFYGAPAISVDGGSLAWISWSLPDMPWFATRLWRADVTEQGELASVRSLEPPHTASVQQPRFADGNLMVLSDHDGWWQPFLVSEGGAGVVWNCLEDRQADHGNAPWQLAEQHGVSLSGGGRAWVCYQHGYGELWWRSQWDSQPRRLLPDCVDFRSLQSRGDDIFCVARHTDAMDSVWQIRPETGYCRRLAGGERPIPAQECVRPRSMVVPVESGSAVQLFHYPPISAADAAPPVILRVHGGPTSAAYPVFDPQAQFWLQRGFAVVDVNYRGSSGFGRDYRLALAGRWGELDVADIHSAVDFLARKGVVDTDRAFIQGRSAGGFTVLMAMLDNSRFRAGASLFGVSDPSRLRAMTHRFESGYLDWLLGDPESHPERWRERTPVSQGHRIRRPMIFFQGGQDRVVVPEQTEAMVAALEANGQSVSYHFFPEEGHGFRRAERQAFLLQTLLEFYNAH
ncbi:Dipeptidyl aminopeptidase/acylaminoacyl peptidase [Marinobacter daqiaonensis]|uniref:Dipeptidyl aminopeptidase/acylaminoacyl peptidase n=1 Tax=Marinobacter daqiaonensis TaxID=650891 RepID=A0A1I6HYG5_9GAMM|nr:prolyl oligopeptidase family serine peptidase [Marinobacter daqiaonensis]SFR59444.1 Dipeptidyl aminopeptidase/acylaminoacyl peptidase [Marinobacter daqiaonensis]